MGRGRKRMDMVGERFGRITVIEYVEARRGHLFYKVRCDCGYEYVVVGHHARSGCSHLPCPLRPRKPKKYYPTTPEQQKVYREQHRSTGKCIRCIRDAANGFTRCDFHLEVARQDEKRRKARKRQTAQAGSRT